MLRYREVNLIKLVWLPAPMLQVDQAQQQELALPILARKPFLRLPQAVPIQLPHRFHNFQHLRTTRSIQLAPANIHCHAFPAPIARLDLTVATLSVTPDRKPPVTPGKVLILPPTDLLGISKGLLR